MLSARSLVGITDGCIPLLYITYSPQLLLLSPLWQAYVMPLLLCHM
jgi:hypothetical protein